LSRLPEIGTSIFTVMSRMADEHNAINLSQGFPDFNADPDLIELMHQAMVEGFNQYAPMPGYMPLRQIIADVIEKSYGRLLNPENEITITAGGTEALFASIAAFIKQGDEVIIFDPSYDSYGPSVRLNGGIPVYINLNPPDFCFPWDRVRSAISSKTRMIIINTPHNPCGTILSVQDHENLLRICQEFNILILSDEVYERIIFDGEKHASVLSDPNFAPYAIAVFSFGKTFHVTGWKSGYAVASPSLTNEIRKAHQFINFSVNAPVQRAIATYMKNADKYLGLGIFYQEKRDFFLEQLKGSPFNPLPCRGSYFQLVSYKGVFSESDVELSKRLTIEKKLASIPVSVFYKDGSDHQLLRFCFAKKKETLAAAGEILRNL
jgi:methionine aminotransferase